jgi:hypothetical protein
MSGLIVVLGIASIIFFSGLLIGIALMLRGQWDQAADARTPPTSGRPAHPRPGARRPTRSGAPRRAPPLDGAQ